MKTKKPLECLFRSLTAMAVAVSIVCYTVPVTKVEADGGLIEITVNEDGSCTGFSGQESCSLDRSTVSIGRLDINSNYHITNQSTYYINIDGFSDKSTIYTWIGGSYSGGDAGTDSFTCIGSNGTIQGGNYSGEIHNLGTIKGGTFKDVYNWHNISGGLFTGNVDNMGTIYGGIFLNDPNTHAGGSVSPSLRILQIVNGTVDNTNGATTVYVVSGKSISFTADTNANQSFAKWESDPIDLTTSQSIDSASNSIIIPDKNVQLTALYGPHFTGDISMSLTAGYAAVETGAYTTSGTGTITVSKVSGNDLITYGTDNKLHIAAGLPAGSYPVVLSATDDVGTTELTFTLNVSDAPVVESVAEPSARDASFLVTFLDQYGNTVKVEWVKYGENATPPTGYGNYSGYTNVTANIDLRPEAGSAGSSKYRVPNTADKG